MSGHTTSDVLLTHYQLSDIIEVRLRFDADTLLQAMTRAELNQLELAPSPVEAVEILAGAIARGRAALLARGAKLSATCVVEVEQRKITC